ADPLRSAVEGHADPVPVEDRVAATPERRSRQQPSYRQNRGDTGIHMQWMDGPAAIVDRAADPGRAEEHSILDRLADAAIDPNDVPVLNGSRDGAVRRGADQLFQPAPPSAAQADIGAGHV